MCCSSYIRRHVWELPIGQLCATRDFLTYGSRGAVDQALSRLVKSGILIRVARGVFIREGSIMPSAMEVARAKARAFGKEIARHAADLAKELGLTNVVSQVQRFAVNGRSSSFLLGAARIFLKGTSMRKMRLANSRAGDAIRALWHLGYCDPQHIYLATSDFTREDRNEFRRLVAWMPTWLAQVCRSCGTVYPVEPAA